MKTTTTFSASAFLAALLTSSTYAQTYSTCNPTLQSCPADPALGGSSTADLTAGASSQYTATGNSISYNSAGGQFTVAASGNNPTLTSTFYIMFGHVDFVFKAAPGVGMVSSAILLSDDLDEIDWEVLGYQPTQAQTNYFNKGQTGTVDPGQLVSVPTSQTDFNTYSIDWTADQIVWSVNGATVRTLTYSESGGLYPQTPMQVKIGSWAGGDSTNNAGTIQWAGGPINYADGPFVMQVQSVAVTDYSTGKEYQYQGTSGTWQSIVAVDGTINSSGTPSSGSSSGSSSAVVTTTSASSTPSSSVSSSASFLSQSSSVAIGVTSMTSSTLQTMPSQSSSGPDPTSSVGITTTTSSSTSATTTPTPSTTPAPVDGAAGRSATNGFMLAMTVCLISVSMFLLS